MENIWEFRKFVTNGSRQKIKYREPETPIRLSNAKEYIVSRENVQNEHEEMPISHDDKF